MRYLLWSLTALLLSSPLVADDPAKHDTSRGDALVARYFELETARVTGDCLAEIETLEDWTSRKDEYRRQLHEMLGLDPLPEKTPLNAVVTGKIDQEDFSVEKVHFQSRPGMYVTGSLYLPKNLDAPAPAILYVCGHGRSRENGISFGNKAVYQHHGIWFARNGYACLIIDTVQMGEIEGVHHGTHNLGQWWWLPRGYTSAGAEAWNCVRALDYLETRPEVDKTRFGVTGRSGGGAYSWWVAALDERIKAAVPVAGITSMKNHIVDGCIEGHCDCMFMVNTYQWDFPLLAALIAPRPLLLSNTDTDRIFPLDGVYDVFVKTRPIYELYNAQKDFGLQITQGGHLDTQELRTHAFVWFDRYLKQEKRDGDLDTRAPKRFQPQELKVFDKLPADERVTTVQEWFVPQAKIGEVTSSAEWETLRKEWKETLLAKTFRAWPTDAEAPTIRKLGGPDADGVVMEACDFDSQEPYRIPLIILRAKGTESQSAKQVELQVLDQAEWEKTLSGLIAAFPKEFEQAPGSGDKAAWKDLVAKVSAAKSTMFVLVAPRGIGPTEWTRDNRERTHIRRRFALLGQTDDGMRTYDVVRAVQAIRGLPEAKGAGVTLAGRGDAGIWSLYAAIFEPSVTHLQLSDIPVTHAEGPVLLNVLKTLDVPQAIALAAERIPVTLSVSAPEGRGVAGFAKQTAEKLKWKHAVTVQEITPAAAR